MERYCLTVICRWGHGMVLVGLLVGCQVPSSIHVWAPPQLRSTVGRKVAIAPINGDAQIAKPLHVAMLAHSPRDPGREIFCVDGKAIEQNQTIRLASALEGETSDIAMLSAARRQGVDFVLTGEVLKQPSEARQELHRANQALDARSDEPKGGESQVTVSWKLVDVHGQTPAMGFPLVTRYEATLDDSSIANLIASDAWKLIAPSVATDRIKLAAPRLSLGSVQLRRGNQLATEGQWMLAEEAWEKLVAANPNNHAALHNLAIAAVARQDFDGAALKIGAALRLKNKPLYRETAVWIEARQRDYHLAFDLPDPVNGWSATSR